MTRPLITTDPTHEGAEQPMSDDEYVPTLREQIAEAIPNSLFATPVVGIGGARRLKVAAAVMPVVDEALAAAEARGYDRAIANLRNEDAYSAWLETIDNQTWNALAGRSDFIAPTVSAAYLEAAKETPDDV